MVSSLFFQLCTIYFELVPGINSNAVYCFLQHKTLFCITEKIIKIIPLLDFDSAAINAFREAYPNAKILTCYFLLTKNILKKVNEIGIKLDYESDDNLRFAVRCFLR